MCKKVKEEIPYCEDATNSWSGYIYQGKIAIYLALLKINKLIEEGKKEDIPLYGLEMEWVEDFSIIYNKDSLREYHSIHQVKARADKNINKYDDAITKLYQKTKKLGNIENAFLHILADNLSLNGYTWNESVKNIVREGKAIKEDIDLVSEYYHLSESEKIKEINKLTSRGVNNKANRLVRNCNNEEFKFEKITLDNIDIILLKIIEDLKSDLEVNKNTISEECLQKIELYGYSTGRDYCKLDEIDDLLKEAIKAYWNISGAESWQSQDDPFTEIVKQNLWAHLDKHIVFRHKNYGNTDKRDINFSDLKRIMDSDESLLRCEAYYLSLLKAEIISQCDSYHEECLEDWDTEEECEARCVLCEINRFKQDIMNMDEANLKELFILINPDNNSKFDKMGHASFCNDLKNKNSLFIGIRDIAIEYEKENIGITYIGKDRKSNLLTTVQTDGSKRALARSCKKIMLNKNIQEILMDYDTIISKDFDIDSIYDGAGDFTKEFKLKENHIYHYKKVKMKSITSAIEEFER